MTFLLQPVSLDIPVSLFANDTDPSKKHLVVGSLTTAQDQGYQTLVKALEGLLGVQGVERQLWDRIVAQAAVLAPSSYAAAHILLAPTDLKEFDFAELLGPVAEGLVEGGRVVISGGVEEGVVKDTLEKVGLGKVEVEGRKITATKTISNGFNDIKRTLNDATPTTSAPTAYGGTSVPLKLRRSNNNSTKKASLWALTSAPPATGNEGLIDDDALLTAEDLARPSVITRPDCDVKKTRKACKNCTCGLRELQLAEEDDLPAGGKVAVHRSDDREGDELGQDGVKKQVVKVGNVTSSCGNCYLGDAFRCSGCPYLGLPAFEPGQKVVLTDAMGDDI